MTKAENEAYHQATVLIDKMNHETGEVLILFDTLDVPGRKAVSDTVYKELRRMNKARKERRIALKSLKINISFRNHDNERT